MTTPTLLAILLICLSPALLFLSIHLALRYIRSRLWWAQAVKRQRPVVVITALPRSVGIPTKWRKEHEQERWS